MKSLDKIKGGMFGLAIGDALGGTTEFMSEEQIKSAYGQLTEIIGSGRWNLKPGETTDDTAMALCVAKGIIKDSHYPIEHIGEQFLNWKNTNPKDIGITISYAFLFYKTESNWENAARKTDDYLGGHSAGNGSLMRCLPISLAYKNEDKIRDVSKKQSKMTHFDDLASEACIIYNLIAYDLLYQQMSMKNAIENRIKGTLYEQILKNDPNCLPTGFVVDTFLWVLRTLYTKETFEEVVQFLANKGEDADTTAAIAGGLKGIEVGYENLPDRYKEMILLKEEINEISEKLYRL